MLCLGSGKTLETKVLLNANSHEMSRLRGGTNRWTRAPKDESGGRNTGQVDTAGGHQSNQSGGQLDSGDGNRTTHTFNNEVVKLAPC